LHNGQRLHRPHSRKVGDAWLTVCHGSGDGTLDYGTIRTEKTNCAAHFINVDSANGVNILVLLQQMQELTFSTAQVQNLQQSES